jgi:hypothetical protein
MSLAFRAFWPCLAFSGCIAPDAIEVDATPPTEKLEYSTFYTGDEDAVGDLLAPIVTMRHQDGRVVSLLGMVHLADAAFYDAVAAECAKADRVLLEGVRGSPSLGISMLFTNCVFATQRRAAHFMNLASQGEAFAVGDNAENGDTTLAAWDEWQPWYTPLVQTVTAPLLVVILEAANLEFWAFDTVTNLTFTNRAYELQYRRIYADLLGERDTDDENVILPGVLGYRNDVLLGRIDEEFAEEGVTTIAAPWGAAHLSGLIGGLKTRGFEQSELRWHRVWSIKSELDSAPDDQPAAFYIPWVIFVRSFRGSPTFALGFDSIYYNARASGAWRFELLWELLYSQSGDAKGESSAFRVGPQLLGRPLLLERIATREAATWRFLMFFDV